MAAPVITESCLSLGLPAALFFDPAISPTGSQPSFDVAKMRSAKSSATASRTKSPETNYITIVRRYLSRNRLRTINPLPEATRRPSNRSKAGRIKGL